MDQVLWQTMHGQIFAMTSPTLATLHSRLAIHGDLLLLAYTPFYAIWQDPRTLITVQLLAVASGVLPLFWLARRQLTVGWSVVITGLYLLQPTIHWMILFDVHAVVLATPLVLWIVWTAVTKRFVAMWVVFGLTILAKEEVGLILALTALVFGWRKILTRRSAWVMGVSALSWVMIVTGLILPRFATNESHFAIEYFSEYGRTVPEIFIGLLQHPVVLWHDLINPTSLGYVAIILGSVAFLPIRRPLWLLPALPVTVMNLISNDQHMQTLYYQYTATITPFVMLATIDGLARSLKFPLGRLATWMIVWVGVMVWLWAPLPGMRHHHDAIRVFSTNPYAQQVRELAQSISQNTKLVVTNDLGPQFSRRERIWVFPFAVDQADAAVILLNRERDVLPQADIKKALSTLQNDPRWETVASWNNELFYLKKKN